jgi:hypothetical protein
LKERFGTDANNSASVDLPSLYFITGAIFETLDINISMSNTAAGANWSRQESKTHAVEEISSLV